MVLQTFVMIKDMFFPNFVPIEGMVSGDLFFSIGTIFNPPKPGPQSRALCGNVCAISIAILLY